MKTQPIKVQSLTATQRLFQKPWLASVAMALGFWVASSLVATAEPTPTPEAPAALPNHPTSGEPASPAGADLELLTQVSTQAQDLQVADPVVVSGANTVAVSAPRLEGSSLAEVPAPVEPSSPVAQASEGEGAAASDGTALLARQSQNPIANLISVPFQNNTNFGVGDFDRTSNILNIQPVIPTSLNKDWVLINRTIIPVAYQPELAPGVDNVFGLGDIFYQGFFSPKNSGSFTWGVGPAIMLPTATDEVLGTGQWTIGPAAVGVGNQWPHCGRGVGEQYLVHCRRWQSRRCQFVNPTALL